MNIQPQHACIGGSSGSNQGVYAWAWLVILYVSDSSAKFTFPCNPSDQSGRFASKGSKPQLRALTTLRILGAASKVCQGHRPLPVPSSPLCNPTLLNCLQHRMQTFSRGGNKAVGFDSLSKPPNPHGSCNI